jgi:acyl carrier protein
MSAAAVREIVKEHGRLAVDLDTLPDEANLYEAGMTSHASVNVMLALEDAFDIEFPDEMLKRSVFESIASIDGALRQLHQEAA